MNEEDEDEVRLVSCYKLMNVKEHVCHQLSLH